jgi:protein-tyrosine-phosphatase
MAAEAGLDWIEIRSAGTHAGPGAPASDGARRAAVRRGRSLEGHSSTTLSTELVDWADLIFVMGPGHLHQVGSLGGAEKAVLLGAFAIGQGLGSVGSQRNELAVPDPFGGDDELYEETFKILETYVDLAMRRLAGEGAG